MEKPCVDFILDVMSFTVDCFVRGIRLVKTLWVGTSLEQLWEDPLQNLHTFNHSSVYIVLLYCMPVQLTQYFSVVPYFLLCY